MRHLAVLAAFFFSACGQYTYEPTSHLKQMFENAHRRDATAEEAAHVARLDMGCAAFFVANAPQAGLMISARHCVDNDAASWCREQTTITTNDGREGICKDIVAADDDHDIFLFESSFAYDENAALALAQNPPAVGKRLVMIGYPTDPSVEDHVGRDGALTATEDCWILGFNYKSVYADRPPYLYKDASALHNCSTYGGNSGGPMIEEGTRIALGLPFTYKHDDFHERDAEEILTSANMAQLNDFVAAYAETLKARGVTIEANETDQTEETSGLKDNPTLGR